MPIDGIVGLGFSDLSDTKPLMDTLVEEMLVFLVLLIRSRKKKWRRKLGLVCLKARE